MTQQNTADSTPAAQNSYIVEVPTPQERLDSLEETIKGDFDTYQEASSDNQSNIDAKST